MSDEKKTEEKPETPAATAEDIPAPRAKKPEPEQPRRYHVRPGEDVVPGQARCTAVLPGGRTFNWRRMADGAWPTVEMELLKAEVYSLDVNGYEFLTAPVGPEDKE